MKLKKIFQLIGLALLVCAGSLGYLIWKELKGPTMGGDFSLTLRGSPWDYSDDAKSVNLIYFGYAKCPDVCPMSLSYMGTAFSKLSQADLKKIRFLFVSVDHENDDPGNVADYATNFFPEFLGLSGSKTQIDDTIKLFPASYMVEKNPKSYLGYSIIHTDRVFILDKKGIVIDTIDSLRDSDVILQKIKEHI